MTDDPELDELIGRRRRKKKAPPAGLLLCTYALTAAGVAVLFAPFLWPLALPLLAGAVVLSLSAGLRHGWRGSWLGLCLLAAVLGLFAAAGHAMRADRADQPAGKDR